MSSLHLGVDRGDGGGERLDLDRGAGPAGSGDAAPACPSARRGSPRGAPSPGRRSAPVSRTGSVSPSASASSTARPDLPTMSVSTEASLRFASSSVFWMRWTWLRPLTHEPLARPVQVAHRAGAGVGHEALADHAVREQVGEPDRVGDVARAAGDVLHLRGLGQAQCTAFFGERRPDRAPVDAGGLHRDAETGVPRQPVSTGPGAPASRSRRSRPHAERHHRLRGRRTAATYGLLVHLQNLHIVDRDTIGLRPARSSRTTTPAHRKPKSDFRALRTGGFGTAAEPGCSSTSQGRTEDDWVSAHQGQPRTSPPTAPARQWHSIVSE